MNRRTIISTTALGLALVLSSSQSGMAAQAANTNAAATKPAETKAVVHTLANLKPIKISAKSTAQLTDVNILTLDEENILTYTLVIQNNDGKTMDLLDYWSKVKTASGTTYSTSLMTKDKEKKKLSSGSSTTLTFVAKIGKNVKVSDLLFQVIKWDFSQAGYESLKGQFKIPADYLTSTPSNFSKTLKVFDTPVKAQVSQVATFVSGDYNYVNVSLDVTNIGYKLFEDPKLKFVIRTNIGASYPMTADSTSMDYRIQPQDKKTLNLMTSIPKSINLDKMELQLVQDDETSKLSLPIATMQLPGPSDKSLAIEPNVEKFIPVGSGKIAVSLNSAAMMQSFDEHDLTIRVGIRNTSGSTMTIPKYNFEVHTSDGYRLPITSLATEDIKLQPLEERILNLNVTVPANVSPENPQLFMNLPATEDATDGFSYPAAIFALPEIQPVQNMIGQTQFVQTPNGILGFSLQSIQRLPWSDGDLVSAKIKITNTGYRTIMLPEMAGLVKVDAAPLTADSKMVATQSVGLLGANRSTDVYIVSKVPGYLDFSQLQISLLEKIGENTAEWVQFSNVGALPSIPSVAKGEVHTINTPGRQTDLKVLRSFIYTGQSTDMIYAELEAKNLEKYQIELSQFAGSFQTPGGKTYKANVSQVETSTGPDEKSIVALWAKVPKNISTDDIKLIVGESITDDKMTPIKGESTGYVNATTLDLGVTTPNTRGSLADLDLFPYTLTVRNVKATISGTSVDLVFDYTQKRDMDYTIGEFGHKYLFEVVDASGRTFEKEFVPETDLKLTANGNAGFSFSDPVFQDRSLGNFTLNVYDLFEGSKMKLGSHVAYYISNTVEEEY